MHMAVYAHPAHGALVIGGALVTGGSVGGNLQRAVPHARLQPRNLKSASCPTATSQFEKCLMPDCNLAICNVQCLMPDCNLARQCSGLRVTAVNAPYSHCHSTEHVLTDVQGD
jgi:hypothetical protein